MTYADQIYTEAQALPEDLQRQLLDFVYFLQWKMQMASKAQAISNTEDLALENHYTTAILESEEDVTTGNTITHQDLKNEVQQWRNQ
jgi:hypothetical protein